MLFLFSSVMSFAQRRTVKVAKNNKGQKALVVKGKNNNKASIVKTKRGTGVVVSTKSPDKRLKIVTPVANTNKYVSPKRTRSVNHRYVALPKRGVFVNTVHSSAIIYRFGGVSYRFYNGVWYQPFRNQWKVVRPNFGFTIKVLPVGYRVIKINNIKYYYYYGTFYSRRGGVYVVVNAPLGAEIISLPTGYTIQVISGITFYELDGVYYKSKINYKGEQVLVVIKNPRISIT